MIQTVINKDTLQNFLNNYYSILILSMNIYNNFIFIRIQLPIKKTVVHPRDTKVPIWTALDSKPQPRNAISLIPWSAAVWGKYHDRDSSQE